ncbi:DUF6296 family protein [Streptomyces sp. NPDC059761]|uniref:DUF6296 family protein n=1 Tax=unclassified Streptomyces TaxID=2593676 RepID=UPI0036537B0C|nr:DUF6296 family protein [Streptomyces sp. NBC_01006]
MSAQRYELVFSEDADTSEDVVVVSATGQAGPGGHPVYADASGIVRAEISDQEEVRILASGGGQDPARVVRIRPLP